MMVQGRGGGLGLVGLRGWRLGCGGLAAGWQDWEMGDEGRRGAPGTP